MKFLLTVFMALVFWQFFLLGKIPVPTDLLVGAYYPWLDYKWGYTVGVPVKNAGISDVFSAFYPWKFLVVDLFKNKTLPLWNSYSFSGTPLLASYHTGVFFPFNLILFLPKSLGWGLFIFGQFWVAAMGMYYLLTQYVKSASARVIGAVVFSLSGLMTTWAEFGTGVWAAAFLPWIFYFLNNYLRTWKMRYLTLFSVSFTCLYLAGHAQLTLFSTLLCGLYLLHQRLPARQLCIVGAFVLLGLGISAVELVPAFHQVSLSVRGSDEYIKSIGYGLTPLWDMVRLFSADFFGNPATKNYFGDISYHENSPFLATLTLPLILPLFIKRFRDSAAKFWLGTFAVSLFLALDSPLTRILYSLPLPFITFSAASRIFFVSSFSAGLLAGFGADKLIVSRDYARQVLGFSFIFILLLAVSLLATSVSPVSLRNSLLPAALLVFFSLALLAKIPGKLLIGLLLVLVFFDLARYFLKYNPFVPPSTIFPPTPVTDFLQSQTGLFRIGRLSKEVLPPNSWIPYRLSSPEGYDPLALQSYARFINRVNGVPYLSSTGRFVETYTPDINFLAALNVRYLVGLAKDASPSGLRRVFTDKSTVVYENPDVLDRSYFVSSTRVVHTDSQLAAILDDPGFDPRAKAVVLTDSLLPSDWSAGQAKFIYSSPNRLSLQTQNPGPGFLIVADSYDPGWFAAVDHRPAKIYPANGALRGLVLPPGNHLVEMTYRPPFVIIGILISVISLLGLGLVGSYTWRT